MKIKNTRELRLRADAHARLGHIAQGTYGDVSANGDVEFKGCAVGCLSTPHRKRDLLAWLKDKVKAGEASEWADSYDYCVTQSAALKALGEEFGITKRLAIVAEAAFEHQETHGQAIEFVREFAHALPEDVDIQDRHVEAFLRRVGFSKLGARRGSYDRVGTEAAAHAGSIEAFTDQFLSWVRSRAPQPVAA